MNNLLSNNLKLVSIKEAGEWASKYLNRNITNSNISYLIQYGRINKYGTKKQPLICIDELKKYYDSFNGQQDTYKQKLGTDLNWHLSFSKYTESERTKHVHSLHPYKGKYIPQLVEYFIDSHTDEYKKQIYFNKGDIILDPFCGSGTTLVQANELGIHAIGIDISLFNTLISEVKVNKHNLSLLKETIDDLNKFYQSKKSEKNQNIIAFEEHLSKELAEFNNKYFPSPEYKKQVANKLINEKEYSQDKEKEFLPIYTKLTKQYNITLLQNKQETFLDKWFLNPIREEIDLLAEKIKLIKNTDIRNVLTIILTRTVRSCRATTHADLATLKKPISTIYYCKKHGKICKPIFSISKWWEFYTKDTIDRLEQFNKLRTDTFQICLAGDSKTIDILEEVRKRNPQLAQMIEKQKIAGIFTSPPYVGLINYHEQHAYAYDIFGFERNDNLEICPLFKGQSKKQQKIYVSDIASVLINCKKYLKPDYDIFLVANDKYNLYPKIAELAKMKIINTYKRPVLNRTEKDRNTAYSEIIFHLKDSY